MATSTEAQMLRGKLKRKITEAQKLQARSLSQVCDGDLPWDAREEAYSLVIACEHAVLDLEGSLDQVNEALR